MDLTAVNSNPVAAGAVYAAPVPVNGAAAYPARPGDPSTASPFEQQMQDALGRSSIGSGATGAKTSSGANDVDAGANNPQQTADSAEPAEPATQSSNSSAALPSGKGGAGVISNRAGLSSKNESASGQPVNTVFGGAVGALSNPSIALAVPAFPISQTFAAVPLEPQAVVSSTIGTDGALGSAGENAPSSVPNDFVSEAVDSNAVPVNPAASPGDRAAFNANALPQVAAVPLVLPTVSTGIENQNAKTNESMQPGTLALSATGTTPVKSKVADAVGVSSMSGTSNAAPTTGASVGPLLTEPDNADSHSAIETGSAQVIADRTNIEDSLGNKASALVESGSPQNEPIAVPMTNSIDTSQAKTVGVPLAVGLPPVLANGAAPNPQTLVAISTAGPIASPPIHPRAVNATTQDAQPDPAASSSPTADVAAAQLVAGSSPMNLPIPSTTGPSLPATQIPSEQSDEIAAIARGATLQPNTSSTPAKRASSPTIVTATKQDPASRSAAPAFVLPQAEQTQHEKELVPKAAPISADPKQITPPDPKAAPRVGASDSPKTPSDTENTNSVQTIPTDTLFARTLTQLTPAAVVHQDAVVEAATAQAQTLSVPVTAPHANATSSTSPAAPPSSPNDSASTSAPLPDPDGTQMHFVGNAKLVQTASHSEMRIAMDSDKFGPVELRARIVGDEIGAAITVEKRDAHAALAVELPALQQALSEKQFRVDQVTLVHGSLHSTSGDAGTAAREQQEQRQAPGGSAIPWSATTLGSHSASHGFFYGSETAAIFDSQGRLSVHA
jgi:Flagellar hook-length control protein FliK